MSNIFGSLSPSDPVQELKNETPSLPPEEIRSRKLVWVIIASGVVLAIAIGIVIYGWIHYSRKFTQIDHSADHIQSATLPNPAPVPGSPNMVRFVFATTYSNSPAGVTLKLPGIWSSTAVPSDITPGPSARYCLLSSHDFLAVFWPVFPTMSFSLEADAQRLVTRFAASGSYILQGRRDLLIHGLPAKELTFLYEGKFDYRLVVVRKWPAVYLLAFAGASNATDSWKELEDALPDSIEIK